MSKLTGSRTLWNLPILSITHASCCGTKLITVFLANVGEVVEIFLKYMYSSLIACNGK